MLITLEAQLKAHKNDKAKTKEQLQRYELVFMRHAKNNPRISSRLQNIKNLIKQL